MILAAATGLALAQQGPGQPPAGDMAARTRKAAKYTQGRPRPGRWLRTKQRGMLMGMSHEPFSLMGRDDMVDEPLTGEHDKRVELVHRLVSDERMIEEIHDLPIGEESTKVIAVVLTRRGKEI
jgi:hypothetical protein